MFSLTKTTLVALALGTVVASTGDNNPCPDGFNLGVDTDHCVCIPLKGGANIPPSGPCTFSVSNWQCIVNCPNSLTPSPTQTTETTTTITSKTKTTESPTTTTQTTTTTTQTTTTTTKRRPSPSPSPSPSPRGKDAQRRSWSRIIHRGTPSCPPGTQSCPVDPHDASRGEECVSFDDVDNCGGCASTGQGVACGADRAKVWAAQCVKGKCEIQKCRPGYHLNGDKSACV